MLNPFEFAGFPLWPLAVLVLLGMAVGMVITLMRGRVTREEDIALELPSGALLLSKRLDPDD